MNINMQDLNQNIREVPEAVNTIEDRDLYKTYFNDDQYYIEKFEKYRNGKRFSFNIWPFLFGLYWFLYRKMNLEAFIIYVVYLVGGFILYFRVFTPISSSRFYILPIVLFFNLILGYLGNYLYLRKAERQIKNYKDRYSNNTEKLLQLSLYKKGGSSVNGVIIGYLISSAITVIIIAVLFLQLF
ncbi:MAG: DUF2628 domain-containing protein [Prevotella sp.]|jgi:hypothetical protein|nr:DUF2628 domain-containing protein [Prevotella sp.]